MATATDNTMTLVPVPQSKLPILTPIFAARIEEGKASERVTVEKLNENILACYKAHSKGAFVDSLDDPKHCVIIGTIESLITDERTAFVSLLYSDPDERGDKEALTAMKSCIENYATMAGANAILISSWVFRGCKDISPLLANWGFEPQEIAHIKILPK